METDQWDLKDSISVKMVNLPLDILSKCIVCVAHLGGVDLVLDSVEPIIKGDLEVSRIELEHYTYRKCSVMCPTVADPDGFHCR